MSYIKFKYQQFASKSLPIIPFNIEYNNKWFEFWGYVDSGATANHKILSY